MNKLLLDTNAYSSYFADDRTILGYLAQADQIFLSVFVLGELYAGFKAGSKEKLNRNFLERFLDKPDVSILEAKAETAEFFGFIKAGLLKTGRLIPNNDIWIAAQALETGSVLVTYDTHFLAVPGIRVWDELRDEK